MYTRWRHVWGNFLRGTQQLGRSTSPWRIFNKRLTFNLFLMILVWLMTAFHVSASIDSHSPSFAKPSLYQTMFSIFQCHFHEPTSRDKWNTQRLELQISFMDGGILSHASRVYFLRFSLFSRVNAWFPADVKTRLAAIKILFWEIRSLSGTFMREWRDSEIDVGWKLKSKSEENKFSWTSGPCPISV